MGVKQWILTPSPGEDITLPKTPGVISPDIVDETVHPLFLFVTGASISVAIPAITYLAQGFGNLTAGAAAGIIIGCGIPGGLIGIAIGAACDKKISSKIDEVSSATQPDYQQAQP